MQNQIDRLPDLPDDADYSKVKLRDAWGDASKSDSGYFCVTYDDGSGKRTEYRSKVCNRRSALKDR